MPIIAMCPYCRAGGVRAPDRAVGQSATCPKCQSSFTIVPAEELPGRPAEQYEVAKPSRPRAVPADETRAFEPADVTEPSPVLTEDRPATPAPAPLLAPGLTEPSSASAADPALVFALVAVSLFGLGMLATLFPFGRVIGLGLCGLGVLLGLLCLLAEGRARIAGAVGAGLNALAALLLLFAPGWLGLRAWSNAVPEDEGPKVPVAVGHGTNIKAPADWVEADKASWQFDDLRVTVKPVVIGPLELVGPGGVNKKVAGRFLQIPITLANIGADRRIEIRGWATGSGEGIRLTDPAGQSLTREKFEAGWEPAGQARPSGLFPGNSAELVLVYEAPASRIEFLRLELPGAAVGTEHAIRFRIPTPLPSLPRKP